MKSSIQAVFVTAFHAVRVPGLLKRALMMGVPVLLAGSAHAQYTTYLANMDHVYASVESITKADPNLQNSTGYVVASTVVDAPAAMMYGEVIRTGPGGAQLWTVQYPTPMKSRFMSIEKYNFSGTTNYVVTGSVQNGGGNDDLLVTCLDDNGGVIRSADIPGATLPNLVGLKAIATSDGNFAVVALASMGYTNVDPKFTVVIKLDSFLNVLYYHVYETPSSMTDFDSPTDIVEGATPDEFLIVGTANKNDPFSSYSAPCAMASLIDMPSGMVTWSHHFSTAGSGHWDNAADGWYDANDSTFWILGNSSIIHYFNITHLDHSGSTLLFSQFYSPSSISYDIYGFELKPSPSTPGNFIVGGWKYNFGSSAAVSPMMAEIEPVSGTVFWAQRYTDPSGSSNINRMLSYSENSWLRTTASGQFPYYYNSLMTYRADGRGYTILGSDTVGSTVEMPRLWRSLDLQGYVVCGNDTPNTFYHGSSWGREADLMYMGNFPTGGPYALTAANIVYSEKRCTGTADGSDGTAKLAQELPAVSGTRLYPNPAASYFTVDDPDGLRSVVVTDVCGRELVHVDLNGEQSSKVDIGSLSPGIYIVRFTDVYRHVDARTLQVLR